MQRDILKSLIISSLILLFLTLISFISFSVSSEDDESLHKITGSVFTSDGDTAGNTFVKIIPRDSVQTGDSGTYEITDVPSGEHTIRAYFLGNGHSTSYRKVFIEDDLVLDWYEGHNWVTVEMFDSNVSHLADSPMSTVKLVDFNQSKSMVNGRSEFGPFQIDDYYTLRAYYGDIDHSTQYVRFKMEGSNPNDFDFIHGMNSKYGYITSSNGDAMPGITISNGTFETTTNEDGFFLIKNLAVGSSQSFTFKMGNIDVAPPITVGVTTGPGWMNISVPEKVRYPAPPEFLLETQTIPISMLPIEIAWIGGENTLSYTLTSNEELLYEGHRQSFTFSTEEPGMYEFKIGASNANGTTNSSQKLFLLIMPKQSSNDLWKSGMSWDYQISYSPASASPDVDGIHNATYTVIGSEKVIDSFGYEKDTFLVRVNDEYHLDREKYYRWIDANNLWPLRTYWEDDPSSSSYYQEGTLGWNLTNGQGERVNLFGSNLNLFLHFNRTNIIGVPGHPDVYDDSLNYVSVQEGVLIDTPAGSFSTTHIVITDSTDGIISWELWYNDTVKNWVKKVDRLPGSHADVVEYYLTSYQIPLTPQFITQDGSKYISNDYFVEWSSFEDAESYNLFQNGELVYTGNSTSFYFEDQVDGNYKYELYAILSSEASIISDSINISVTFTPDIPTFVTNSQTIQDGEMLNLSWNYSEDVTWFLVVAENQFGVKTEIYNGTDSFVLTDDLELGQNRIRVQAYLSNGKISGFSDSLFITVVENSEKSSMLSPIFTLAIFVLLSFFRKTEVQK